MKNDGRFLLAALVATSVGLASCDAKPPEVTAAPEPPSVPDKPIGIEAVRQPGASVCIDPYVTHAALNLAINEASKSAFTYSDPQDTADFEAQSNRRFDEAVTRLDAADPALLKTTCSSNFVIASADKEWTVPVTYSAQPTAAGDDFIVEVLNIDALKKAYAAATLYYWTSVIYERRQSENTAVNNQPSDEEKWANRADPEDFEPLPSTRPAAE